MKIEPNNSPAYQRFLDFFKLTQRERLEGLDSSYFAAMTDDEKNRAFDYLKNEPNFEYYPECLRGLYLCDSEKAINLFKDLMKNEATIYETQRDNDLVLDGRIFMSGYICNIEPTKANINRLVELNVAASNRYVRNRKYQLTPSRPTTLEAIEFLKNVIMSESEQLPLASAVNTFMSIFGLEFDMNDEGYKKIYRGLIGTDLSEKQAAIKKLEGLNEPMLAL